MVSIPQTVELQTEAEANVTNEGLIAQYILDEPIADPHKRDEPVLKRTGTPVWAVVGYCLRARQGSVATTARDYALTEDEVRATLAYYRLHPELDIAHEDNTCVADALP